MRTRLWMSWSLCLVLFSPSWLVAASNLILVSGGPGKYEPADKAHDQSWKNYVWPPVLLAEGGKLKAAAGQDVWWFVYKPAYEARWADDLKAKDFRQKQVEEIKKEGHASYVAKVEAWAEANKWKLRWFTSADDFWKKMATFQDPIDRLMYWGHAQGDLWLSLEHTGAIAHAPAMEAILRAADIADHAVLKERFQKGAKQQSQFWGCKTDPFAKAWHATMQTPTMGFEGDITFVPILKTKGEPEPLPGCVKKEYP